MSSAPSKLTLPRKKWTMKRPINFSLLVLLCTLGRLMSDCQSADENSIFPGESWQVCTPNEAALDGDKLNEFAKIVGGDGVVIRNGYLVKSWGQPDRHGDWASAAKPVLSTLLLLAIDDKTLLSADARVKDAGWELNAKDTSLTYRHLANMVSGYACVEPPGAAWAYNDFAIQLYAKSLERVFGRKLDAAIRDRLAPLQFEDGAIFGSRKGLGVVASPRDFARIGWLWLNEGQWNGKPIITQKLFKDHIQPQVPASLPRTNGKSDDYLRIGSYGGPTDQTEYGPGVYGFNFWFNKEPDDTGIRAWPALPPDAYQANGMWNRDTVTIIPSLQLVVAVRGSKLGPFQPGKEDGEANRNLKLLVDACTPIKLPAQTTETSSSPTDDAEDQTSRPGAKAIDGGVSRG